MPALPTAGDLKRVVRFDRRADIGGTATDGNPQGDWQTLIASRRAKLTATRGGEITVGDRLAGIFVYDLFCRADPEASAVVPSDRVVDITDPDNHQVFDIKSVQFFDDRRTWLLMQLQYTTGATP